MGNPIVIRDHQQLLPESHWLDEVGGTIERHDVHMLWQPLAQRAEMMRAALGSPSPAERRAGAMLQRRWGLTVEGARTAPALSARSREHWKGLPSTPACARYLAALEHDPSSLGESKRLPKVAPRPAKLIEEGSPRLGELAARFAELSHAAARTSYWMIRDGAPGPAGAPLATRRRSRGRHHSGYRSARAPRPRLRRRRLRRRPSRPRTRRRGRGGMLSRHRGERRVPRVDERARPRLSGKAGALWLRAYRRLSWLGSYVDAGAAGGATAGGG
jgi:hypothetical protein